MSKSTPNNYLKGKKDAPGSLAALTSKAKSVPPAHKPRTLTSNQKTFKTKTRPRSY